MKSRLPFALLLAIGGFYSFEVNAASVTLKSYDQMQDKDYSIEEGLGVLTEGKLGNSQTIVEVDPLLAPEATRIEASLSISGHHEFALRVNLFKCDSGCKWQIVMSPLPVADSINVEKICNRNEDTIDAMYERYFFCRRAYMGFLAAGRICWIEARQALSGWFDAVYQLHTKSLREGTAFVARDETVEAYVRDARTACPGFEQSVRKIGYFTGMVRELDRAALQATQRVERLLRQGQHESAKRWAETFTNDLSSGISIRSSISQDEVRYVEAILNRALQADPQFRLP